MLLDTPICDFGWKAPNFKLYDFDEKEHKLENLMGENGLLIAFICNHCPYVKTLVYRLVKSCKTLQKEGVNVVAIMSNDYSSYPDDSPEKMKKFANENGFTFPYLVDEDQSVAKVYGAVCTPDFFGFNKNYELQYRGRLDDGSMNKEATNEELLSAMREVIKTGSGPKNQTPSMGCSIKWK